MSSKGKAKLAKSSDLEPTFEKTYARIPDILLNARNRALRAVDSKMVRAYWETGREIVEEEQRGRARAKYGSRLIQALAQRLTAELGQGYTPTNLKYMRQFYLAFPIGHALSDQLSWTHYRFLLSVKNEQARSFYMNESIKANWSTRELDRQIHSLRRGKSTCGFNSLLCTDAEGTIARCALLERDQKVFANRYQLYLPSEKELQAELEREREALLLERRLQPGGQDA